MAGVSQALKRIKSDLAKLIPDEAILAACRAVGHKWRERQLGPVQTLPLFILQVMACNTAMSHLRLLAGEVFSAAAFCEAGFTVLRCDLPFRQLKPKGPPFRGSAPLRGKAPRDARARARSADTRFSCG